jgi:hypothetical protein
MVVDKTNEGKISPPDPLQSMLTVPYSLFKLKLHTTSALQSSGWCLGRGDSQSFTN